MVKPTKRIITKENIREANRLRALWESKKKALGLVQRDVAKQLNWTQGAISQYLNAHTALNTDTILTFARLLQVDPSQIRPGILDNINEETTEMFYTISGANPSPELWGKLKDFKLDPSSLVVYIDEVVPRIEQLTLGDFVIFRKDIEPEAGDIRLYIDNKDASAIKCKISPALRKFTAVLSSIRKHPD